MLPADDRYARQRLISGWRQERLSQATVLVAGTGALGNEAIKNLALLGIGRLVLVDLDRVERSNLSRTVLFTESDVGEPKVVAAERAVARLNPGVRVTALDGDLRFVLGLGLLRACDLALGCLDNQGARAFFSSLCVLAGVPLLDAGMWALGGEVRAFLSADGPCFNCTLAPDERRNLWLRYSCTGGFAADEQAGPAPTAVTTTAIIGGMLAQEAVRLLNGRQMQGGTALVYNGEAGTLHRTAFPRDPGCPHHAPLDWAEVRPLPEAAGELTARTLLARAEAEAGAPATLDLGRDLLLAFDCPGCGRAEPVGLPQRQIPPDAATCPHCGAIRRPQVTSTVASRDQWAGRTLAKLGVPDGEVLSVRAGEHLLFYQLPLPS